MKDQSDQIEKLLTLPVDQRPQCIAELVHRLQVDKAGRPYIDHPRRVAENVQQLPGFEHLLSNSQAQAVAAAWLHDVIEDSGDEAWPKVTEQDLISWGIDADIASIVQLLTRVAGIHDDDYYSRIKNHPIARLVKIADVAENCNEQRILWVEAAGGKRNPVRYQHALAVLDLGDDEQAWFDRRTKLPCELTLNEEAGTL